VLLGSEAVSSRLNHWDGPRRPGEYPLCGMTFLVWKRTFHEDNALPEYRILTNEVGDTRAVKVGFSWPALSLNVLWAVANGLWVVALLIVVLAACGVLLFANTAQSSAVLATLGAVSAGLAFLVFLGFRANDMLTSHLESRGYIKSSVVSAPNLPGALEIASTESDPA
jgi:hypothetical protein